MGTLVSYWIKMLILAPLGVFLWALFRPVRRRRMEEQGLESGPYREGAILLFDVFLAGLLGLTLTPIGFWDGAFYFRPFQGEINLIPLAESLRLLRFYLEKGMWSAILVNFPGNILMFAPIGFFAGLLLDRPRWWKGGLSAFALSFFIESVQLIVSRGTDVDDLILNTLGGLVGYWLFLLLRRSRPDFVNKCGKCRKGSA